MADYTKLDVQDSSIDEMADLVFEGLETNNS